MIKKEYMQPTLEVVMIKQEANILTGSLPVVNENVPDGWAPELPPGVEIPGLEIPGIPSNILMGK